MRDLEPERRKSKYYLNYLNIYEMFLFAENWRNYYAL